MSKKVYVGLSGGVDSSVAALLLKQAGYDVTGVFIKVWHPDFMPCNWEAERVDAMRVAAHLHIPFKTCDGEAAYRDRVASYFIESYKNGLTPNPDVLCNQEVKFGVFMQYALSQGADFVATGHYAQTSEGMLYRGSDNTKDQSYFLWSLTKEQLTKTVFPIGHFEKKRLRTIAAEAKLPTATKKDSQGVCFLGHVDIPDFLSHYIDLTPGSVLDNAGNQIGQHRGTAVYTIGQRHGFTITKPEVDKQPYYVCAKDTRSNTITVDHTPPQLKKNDTITIKNLVLRKDLSINNVYEMQTRYRQKPILVSVSSINSEEITLSCLTQTEMTAPGQSCVLFTGEECLGGGIITQ